MKGADNMEILAPNKVTGQDIKHSQGTSYMRNEELRAAVVEVSWHPEFQRSIVAGTIRRMHMVSKRKDMPIGDYYVADGAWNIFY